MTEFSHPAYSVGVAARFGAALIGTALAGAAALVPAAQAGDVYTVPAGATDLRSGVYQEAGDPFKIEGRVSIGTRTGESKELVYIASTGHKLSELIWTIDDVYMFNAGVTLRPWRWLALNADIATNLTGEAHMNDYDWLIPGQDWTHWSKHEDTKLTSALLWDINAGLSVYKTSMLDLQVIAGYRSDTFDWTADGGNFTYSSQNLDGSFNFRDLNGTFAPGVAGISYRQQFDTPYLGLSAAVSHGAFYVRGEVNYSQWGLVENVDLHHQRNLRFVDKSADTEMVALEVEAGYQVFEGITVTASYKHLDYEVAKGPVIVYDIPSGIPLGRFGADSAGASHQSDEFSLGMTVDLF